MSEIAKAQEVIEASTESRSVSGLSFFLSGVRFPSHNDEIFRVATSQLNVNEVRLGLFQYTYLIYNT